MLTGRNHGKMIAVELNVAIAVVTVPVGVLQFAIQISVTVGAGDGHLFGANHQCARPIDADQGHGRIEGWIIQITGCREGQLLFPVFRKDWG